VFRRSDRRDSPPDAAALAARDAATQGFLALDNEQRAAADAVAAAEEMGTARKLGRSWAEIAAVGDAATEAYLTATRDFPIVDGRGTPGGKAADDRALREIERAREVIRRFRTEHSRVLDEAEFALTSLPRTVQEARTALVSARSAVTRADESGVRSRRAAERLAEAELAAAGLDDRTAGLREIRATAQRTLELARSAVTLAEEAPRTARTVRSALSSITTRRAAAVTKVEQIPPAMSALRREFSEPCSRDLVDAERETAAALVEADAALADAGRLAEAGDWDAAADQVATARGALTRAERHHDAVTDRLAELREVRADPRKQAADTRFVLRDAQRLVVDRGLTARFGPVLDAQSVRLENAQDRLTGPHPDYWLYLTELRGVRDRVKDVVADARHAQPGR
jgi:chromosome segregation ATPase